jgi:O-acetyl-ADP-ribose deacetylase (regulator of RNase III)
MRSRVRCSRSLNIGATVAIVQLEIVRGDITAHEVDAVVNAANSSLLGGGGVDGAIHRAGGPEILAACRALRETELPDGLRTGRAVVTTAGRLAARWVIHTVGPIYDAHDHPEHLLASCYVESLRVADEVGARTVAFPAISCGVYGYPLKEAAPIAIETVREAETAVELVRFVLFSDDAFDAFSAASR